MITVYLMEYDFFFNSFIGYIRHMILKVPLMEYDDTLQYQSCHTMQLKISIDRNLLKYIKVDNKLVSIIQKKRYIVIIHHIQNGDTY